VEYNLYEIQWKPYNDQFISMKTDNKIIETKG